MEDGEMKEDLKEYRRMKMMGKKMVQEDEAVLDGGD